MMMDLPAPVSPVMMFIEDVGVSERVSIRA
jgi:hypothetical protein